VRSGALSESRTVVCHGFKKRLEKNEERLGLKEGNSKMVGGVTEMGFRVGFY